MFKVGPEGTGFNIAMAGLNGGRINISSTSLGAAQQCFDITKDHMSVRKTFGTSLNDHQYLQYKMAEMATKIVTSRLIVREGECVLFVKVNSILFY